MTLSTTLWLWSTSFIFYGQPLVQGQLAAQNLQALDCAHFLSDWCVHNWGIVRGTSPAVPSVPMFLGGPHWFTTNVIQTIKEAQWSATTLCQSIAPVIFHPDSTAFLPSVLARGVKWSTLSMRSNTAHAAPALTETAAPDPATPVAVGSGKINSNCAWPTDGQTVSPSPPADPDSDVMAVASIGGSDGKSDYVELAENSPTSPSNTLDL